MSRKKEQARSRKLERADREVTTRPMTPQNMIIRDGESMGDQVFTKESFRIAKK